MTSQSSNNTRTTSATGTRKDLSANGRRLPDRLRKTTAPLIFLDISRATRLIQEMTDLDAAEDRVVLFFDDDFHLCLQAVTSAGGEVIKYMGDARLAMFPADGAEAAVSAAASARADFPALF